MFPEKSSALSWLDMFKSHTKTTFAIFSSRAGLPHVVFKARARCHHMVPDRRDQPRKKPSKRDSGCETMLTVTVVENVNRERSKLPTRGHALRVSCNGKAHNHPVRTPEVLRHRPVSDSSKAILLDLFERKYSPSDALDILKVLLLHEHGDNYPAVAEDRHYVPDLPYVNRLYSKTHPKPERVLSRKRLKVLQDASHETKPLRGSNVIVVGPYDRAKEYVAGFPLFVEEEPPLTSGDCSDAEWCDDAADDVDEAADLDSGSGEHIAVEPNHGTTTLALTMDADGTSVVEEIVCTSGDVERGEELNPKPAAFWTEHLTNLSPAEAAERFRQWAAGVSEQIASDASGRVAAAADALMDRWRPMLTAGDGAAGSAGALCPVVAPRQTVVVSVSCDQTCRTDSEETVSRARSLCVLRDSDMSELKSDEAS